MNGWHEWWHRCRGLVQKEQLDQRMNDEMRFHLELLTQEKQAAGLSPTEARHAAQRAFGSPEQIKEICRDIWRLRWIETLGQDIHFALRLLLKNPSFSAVIILTLGLGIGLNTAIFSVVNAVLLRSLPYPAPEQLIQVKKQWQPPWQGQPELTPWLEAREILAWQQNHPTLSYIAAYQWHRLALGSGGNVEWVNCGRVSASFFSLLGLLPALGRSFLPEEERPGGPSVVILSHGLWQRHFGGQPSVLGQTLLLENKPYLVVGVMPAAFKFTSPCDVFSPLVFRDGEWANTGVIGRLKPGGSLELAQLTLDAIYRRIAPPQEHGRIILVSLHEHMVGDVKLSALIYLSAVGCVLLIACTNVANLLLARAAYRRKEIAVRLALGARRLRIVRQLLTESVVFATLGAALGLVLAFWSKAALSALVFQLPPLTAVRIDGWVLLFTFLAALVTGLLFGLAPALQASGFALSNALKEGSRRYGQGRLPQRHLSGLLVVLEITLALVLMLGAGLLIKSFAHIQGIKLGFRPEHMLALTIGLNPQKYPTAQRQVACVEQMIERLRHVPGVDLVGTSIGLPLSGTKLSGNGFLIEGQPPDARARTVLYFDFINPDYFQALGISLRQGRWFTDQDRPGTPPVVLINQSLAQQYFADENPLGKRINEATIVGVVEDVRQEGPLNEIIPLLYYPYLQAGMQQRDADFHFASMSFALRTRSHPLQLDGAVRSAIRSVDQDLRIEGITTLEQQLADLLALQRKRMGLASALGFLALGLAAVGIYGVLSFSVAQRTHEIGVRMALGAQIRHVLQMILGEGALLTLAGVFFGLMAAYWLMHYIAGWLFEISALDLSTFVYIPLFLGIVALFACYIPARRAAKVDPVAALRCE